MFKSLTTKVASIAAVFTLALATSASASTFVVHNVGKTVVSYIQFRPSPTKRHPIPKEWGENQLTNCALLRMNPCPEGTTWTMKLAPPGQWTFDGFPRMIDMLVTWTDGHQQTIKNWDTGQRFNYKLYY